MRPPPSAASQMSAAALDLGLGDMLGQQVAGETEEMRKKRMLEMQQKQMLGPTGSLAVTSLFGSRGTIGPTGGMPGV